MTDIGDLLRIKNTFRNLAGNVDDPTTVSLTLIAPNATETVWIYLTDTDLIRLSAGIYYLDFAINQSGRYTGTWVGTGDIEATEPFSFVVRPVGGVGGSFTYSPANVDDPISILRLDLGDTDSTDPLFSDEELQSLITRAGSTNTALGLAYRSLANKYGRLASFSIGGLRVEYAARAILWGHKADMAEGDTVVPVSPVLVGGAVTGALKDHYFTTSMHDTEYTGHDDVLEVAL